MANKFDDIDESKIIKKNSNNVKEENVQQPKTEQKIQPKVQAKVQAKVQPKVQVKQTIKQENIEVKEVKNAEVKTEQKQIKVKQSIESEVKPKIKEKEVKIETNKVEIKSEAVNHVEEVNKNESKKTEINITEKIENKKSFPVFNVDPVTKETSPVSNFNYDSRKKKTMNLNVPIDQLKRIKYDTEKCINEITLDIIILNNLINKNDEYCDYYKNKLANLKNELNFYKQKKLTIQALLR